MFSTAARSVALRSAITSKSSRLSLPTLARCTSAFRVEPSISTPAGGCRWKSSPAIALHDNQHEEQAVDISATATTPTSKKLVSDDGLIATPLADIDRIYNLQRANEYKVAATSPNERLAKLQRLEDACYKYRSDLHAAAMSDRGNHPAETDLVELYAVVHEIRYVRKHLKSWMKPRKVPTPLGLLGTSSYIHHEPKGCSLILSPWNFPFNLSLGPLVSAVAAGNCAILKPSEISSATAQVIRAVVEEAFDENEVAVVDGAIEETQHLLDIPFNHIFFTGAPSIGKIVMEKAAKNLASVTLELGGKSPVIVDESADIDIAAKRVAWAKTLNAGQICVAPDYLYIHESRKDEFLEKYNKHIQELYGNDAKESHFPRIINSNHHGRLTGILQDAVDKGARVEFGGDNDNGASTYMEPTVLTDIDPSSRILTEEIFGPLLPIITYKSLDEPLTFIQSGEKPLALYIYSKDKTNTQRIIDQTRAGATCINTGIVHYFNDDLPFGGSNNSGIGKTHGLYGFKEFTNERAVLEQWSPVAGTDLMAAPYTDIKQKLIDLTVKHF